MSGLVVFTGANSSLGLHAARYILQKYPRHAVVFTVRDASDSDVPNAKVLNTVYDFSFPSGGTLNQAVADNSGQLNISAFCVTVVESLFPANVINNWNDDSLSNGSEEESCQTPLRKRCTDAISDRFASSTPDENGCRGSDLDLSKVKQCEWAFDGGYQASTYSEYCWLDF